MTHTRDKSSPLQVHCGVEFIDTLLSSADELVATATNYWAITTQDTLSLDEGGCHDFLDNLLGEGVSSSPPVSPLWSLSSMSDSGVSEDPDHPGSPFSPSSASFLGFPEVAPLASQPPSQPSLDDMKPDVCVDLGWEVGDLQDKFEKAYYLTTTPGIQMSSSHVLTVKDLLLSNPGQQVHCKPQSSLQGLALNEDEKKLLAKEGINLPNILPLSKSEERALKKIRRKIRNKHSAQESRKKKREYVDSLEGRMSACSAYNLELQRKVCQLEQTNNSLLEQLSRVQELLPNGSITKAKTGTFLLVLVFSFSLLLSPSLQPDPYKQPSLGEYTEATVPSRSLQWAPTPRDDPPPVPSFASRGLGMLSSAMKTLWSGLGDGGIERLRSMLCQ